MFAWLKAHPKVVMAIGAAVVAVAGAFGLPAEFVQKALAFIAPIVGVL